MFGNSKRLTGNKNARKIFLDLICSGVTFSLSHLNYLAEREEQNQFQKPSDCLSKPGWKCFYASVYRLYKD